MFFLLIAVGLVTGVLAGLLGIGGGVITVPALYFIFSYYGIPSERIVHMAVATALASTFLTSIGSTLGHHLKKAILPSALKRMGPALIGGCILGALLNRILPSAWICYCFGVISALLGIYFLFPQLPPLYIGPSPNRWLSTLSIFVGILSSLLGIGGGIFMVPILLGFQVHMKQAVATSAASTLITATVGSILYLFIGWDKQVPNAIGYVHISAFLLIGIGSLITTPLGVKLAHTLPVHMTKRLFGLVLCFTAFAIIAKA